MFRPKTEVYTIKGFLNGEDPIRIEGIDVQKHVKTALEITTHLTVATIVIPSVIHAFAPMVIPVAYASAHATTGGGAVTALSHPVSTQFDQKIWPLFLDVGIPLAKTMMAFGIYKVIRKDDRDGWKSVQRAGLGLVCLYLIDGAVHILENVGKGLQLT